MPPVRNILFVSCIFVLFAIVPGFSKMSGFYQSQGNLRIVDVGSPKVLLRNAKVAPYWHVIDLGTEYLENKLHQMTLKKIAMEMFQRHVKFTKKRKLEILRL